MFRDIHFKHYDFVEKIYDIRYIEFFFEFVNENVDKTEIHFYRFYKIL